MQRKNDPPLRNLNVSRRELFEVPMIKVIVVVGNWSLSYEHDNLRPPGQFEKLHSKPFGASLTNRIISVTALSWH
jgi:hypothetical protein